MECISDARAAAISNSPPPWTDRKPLMEEANSREMGPESSYNESKFPRNLDTSTFLAQRQNKNLFPIGFTLEDFFLDEKLFTTRNSEIWLCNYRFSSKLLVLKVINTSRFQAQHWVNLQREFVSVVLSHTNVINTYGYFFANDRVYFVQEYAKGGNLYQELQQTGPFSEDRIRTILVQLLNAVHYIHSKQIIHRDLKLDNILLMEPNTDRVKVADFGVCFRKTDARGSAETKVGTLDYMAPEILVSHKSVYTEAVDVWALGVMVYEMLYGDPPFSGPDFESSCTNIIACDLCLTDDISEHAQDFLRRVLCKDPQERPSISELMQHPFLTRDMRAVSLEQKKWRPSAENQTNDEMIIRNRMRADFLTQHVRCAILRHERRTVRVMTDCPITRQLLSAMLRQRKYTVTVGSSSNFQNQGTPMAGCVPEAQIYVVDVGPFNVREVYAHLRHLRNVVNPPLFIALVTVTAQRQPDSLADLFDYYIHKPGDRTQMEVFPDMTHLTKQRSNPAS